MDSKTKAEMMVKDAEEAIEAAQARTLGARLMLKNMFNNWKETGNEAAQRINDLSSTQHLVLENTHDLLKSEMELLKRSWRVSIVETPHSARPWNCKPGS